MTKLLVLLSFCGLFMACESHNATEVAQHNFFDLSEFVQENIEDRSVYPSVIRTVKVGDENEVKNLGEYDMTDPLTFLVQFNINRPRWSDKYQKEKEGVSTIYTALDEYMKIRSTEIIRSAEEITEIRIDFFSNTLISKSEKHIVYKPGNQLIIETLSDPLFSESKKTTIKWDY